MGCEKSNPPSPPYFRAADSSIAGTRTGSVFIAGPLEYAVVCIDQNFDMECNGNDPTAITDKDGYFSIAFSDKGEKSAPVLVQIIPQLTIDRLTQKTFEHSFEMTAASISSPEISPLETLLSTAMASTSVEHISAELEVLTANDASMQKYNTFLASAFEDWSFIFDSNRNAGNNSSATTFYQILIQALIRNEATIATVSQAAPAELATLYAKIKQSIEQALPHPTTGPRYELR